MASSSPAKGGPPVMASLLGNVSRLRATSSYNAALVLIRAGRLEEAVLELLESVFYAPHNANPLVALAEVYVLLCDLQSAVHFYRRAVWALTRRERERRREEARRAEEEARNAFLADNYPHLLLMGQMGVPGAGGPSALANAFMAPPVSSSGGTGGIAIPDTTTGDDSSKAPQKKQQQQRQSSLFEDDSGVQLYAVQIRLAGLLDALGLSLYNTNLFAQAHRFCEDAIAVLREAAPASPVVTPVPAEDTQKPAATGEEAEADAGTVKFEKPITEVDKLLPTVELHRCVYLIALQREEEAEVQLEAHHKDHPDFRVQTTALLVHLYVGRQAFRAARILLEEHTAATVRQERALTVGQHIFNEKYRRYRAVALEKRDVGTISQCIEVYPSDTELIYTRARIYIERGELKRSVKDLFRCIKESNSTHREAINTMTDVLIQIGEDSSSGGNRAKKPATAGSDGDDDDDDEGMRKSIEEAITYYSESLKWRADNVNVLLARADCYMRLEDYESALQDYRKMLHLDPDDLVAKQRIAFLHDIWGRKLYATGNVRAAEAEFTNAIKTDEKEALFYYHRALCRFELNEPRFGLRDVLSCQQLNPADPKIRAFIIRYLGSPDVPNTCRGGAAGQNDLGGGPRPTLPPPPSTATATAAKKRAAALYGRESARITKAIREAHDACVTMADNGGVSEASVRRVMIPALPAPGKSSKAATVPTKMPKHMSYVTFSMAHMDEDFDEYADEQDGAGEVLAGVSGTRTHLHGRRRR